MSPSPPSPPVQEYTALCMWGDYFGTIDALEDVVAVTLGEFDGYVTSRADAYILARTT